MSYQEIDGRQSEGRGLLAPCLTIFVLFAGIILIVPTTHIPLYLAKQLIAEWALIIFFVFVIIKNNWVRVFLLWNLFITIHFYNKYSFFDFYTLIFYALFYQAIVDRVKQERVTLILDAVCWITLFNVFWMGLQYFKIDPLFKPTGWACKNPLVGFLLNSNINAAFLAISLPAFFRNRWKFFIPLVVLALVKVSCFTAILSVIGGSIFFLFKRWRGIKERGAVIGILIIGIFVYLRMFENSAIFTGSGRFPVWRDTIKEFISLKPWIGWGLGGYKIAFPVISKIALKYGTTFHQAHNEFLQTVCEIGFPGLVIVFGYLTSLYLKFRRNITSISLVLMSMLVTILIASNGIFLFHSTVGIEAVIVLALLEISLSKKEIV